MDSKLLDANEILEKIKMTGVLFLSVAYTVYKEYMWYVKAPIQQENRVV